MYTNSKPVEVYDDSRHLRRRRQQLQQATTTSLFQILIVSLSTLIYATLSQAQPYEVIKPALVSVVFAPVSKTPPKYLSASAFGTLTGTEINRKKVRGQQPEFRRALTAKTLLYSFPTSPTSSGAHTLRLGIIEPEAACSSLNRKVSFSVNGQSTRVINIPQEGGCQTPLFFDVLVTLSVGQAITLQFSQQENNLNPAIANLRLYKGSAPPKPPLKASLVNYGLNIDSTVPIPGTVFVSAEGTPIVKKVGTIPKAAFSTGRSGASFTLLFDVPSGTYDVTLGFIELQKSKCALGARVFNVYINENVKLPGFDIFKAAGSRCLRSNVQMFTGISIDSVTAPPLTVKFEGVADDALISYVLVRASNKQCIPVTDDAEITDDHLAHSVPGSYKPFVDTTGSGKVTVTLDGTVSHTHFFFNGIQGVLQSFKWTEIETNKVLSTRPKFTRDFPLGSTRIRLDVVDNICSQDDAETVITVTGSKQPGQYCYFYPNMDKFPPATSLEDASVAPVFSSIVKRMKLNAKDLPFQNQNSYVIRCLFFIEFNQALGFTSETEPKEAKVAVKTGGSGDVRVFKGDGELILDSLTTSESASGLVQATKNELQAFEVMFLRNSRHTTNLKLNFKINNATPKSIFHDKATILPIILTLSPSEGPTSGGTVVRIKGFGLVGPLKVYFGGVLGKVTSITSNNEDVFVRSPSFGNPATVSVYVESSNGMKSQSLTFEYGGACDPPQFLSRQLLTNTNAAVDLKQPTSVAYFSDGKIYTGTREGRVRVLEYDYKSLKVTKQCYSEILYDSRYKKADGKLSPRTILGITFHPRDKKPKPYVSTSTLFWLNQKQIDPKNPNGWSNGNIERLKPVPGNDGTGQCLQRDSIVVSGLPIGAADHSVNELVFDQNGDLLISVAGLTNGGLPGPNWGGIWESCFSASVVRAKFSRGRAFDGQIEYTTPADPTTAKPTSKTSQNFDLFATGFRNLFSLIMARNGQLFGVDMGTDCKFGNMSSTCSEYNPATEPFRNRNLNFPGKALVGNRKDCMYSGERNDKLLEIKQGRWYGHSNLQRAAAFNTNYECAWVDPKTGRIPFGNQRPPSQYEHRIALLTSPMTGVREYGSNLFCGKMRGNIIVSRYKETKSLRYGRSIDGGPIDTTSIEITPKGGLRVEENEFGYLLYPKLYKPGVNVLVPNVRAKTGVFIANATPWRHAKKGRSFTRIGGWGFVKGSTSVTIGGRVAKIRFINNDLIVCKVPKWGGGSLIVDVKVASNGIENILPKANMGLQDSDVTDAFAETLKLFSHSVEYKQSELFKFMPENNLGYSALHTENLNHNRPPDLREAFNLRPPQENPQHLKGLPAEFKEWAINFWEKIQKASETFLIAISVALNISPDFLLSACLKHHEKLLASKTVLRLVHYPPCDFDDSMTGQEQDGAIRSGEHTDFGIFTFLFTDSTGLQVYERENGKWTTISPIPNKPVAIVNTGALLQRFTNGRWHAVLHRVIIENQAQASQSRISVILFVNPRDDVVFNPIVQKGDERKYQSVTAQQYLQQRIDHSTGKSVDGVDPIVYT